MTEILLNGVAQTKVIAYDVEQGWLLRYATDANDRIVLNDRRDEAIKQQLRGKVEARWKAEYDPMRWFGGFSNNGPFVGISASGGAGGPEGGIGTVLGCFGSLIALAAFIWLIVEMI